MQPLFEDLTTFFVSKNLFNIKSIIHTLYLDYIAKDSAYIHSLCRLYFKHETRFGKKLDILRRQCKISSFSYI